MIASKTTSDFRFIMVDDERRKISWEMKGILNVFLM